MPIGTEIRFNLIQTSCSNLQKFSRDNHAHDFIGAFQYLVHAGVAQVTLKRILTNIAVTAVQLQRFIADIETQVRGQTFGHGTHHGAIFFLAIQLPGGKAHHLLGSDQLGSHVGEPKLHRLEFPQRLTELTALLHITQ